MKIKLFSVLTIIFVIFTSISVPEAQAGSLDGYSFPWTHGITATLTQLPRTSGHAKQIDFVIGTTALSTSDLKKQYVSASKDGIIWMVNDNSKTECNNYYRSYCTDKANFVVIKHPGNPVTYTWYLHLAYDSIPDKFKDKNNPRPVVKRGEIIGQQGRTGNYNSTINKGVHLHFLVSTVYKDPAKGYRLPSWSNSAVEIKFANQGSNLSYSQLRLQNYKSASCDIYPDRFSGVTFFTDTNCLGKHKQYSNAPLTIFDSVYSKKVSSIIVAPGWSALVSNAAGGAVCLSSTTKDSNTLNTVYYAGGSAKVNDSMTSFRVMPNPNCSVELIATANSTTKYCMDVSNWSSRQGTQLQLLTCTHNANQVWSLIPSSPNKYILKSAWKGMYINTGDNNSVTQSSSLSAWTIENAGGGNFILKDASGKCVEHSTLYLNRNKLFAENCLDFAFKSPLWQVENYVPVGGASIQTMDATITPVFPENNTTIENIESIDITFVWNDINNATEYFVEYSGTSTGDSGWITSTDYSIDLPIGTYTWHVKTRNANSESEWSPTWNFTVQPVINAPAVPALVLPADTATINPDFTFTWNSVSDTTEYYVEYSGTSSGNSDWISATTFSVSSLPAGTYTWHVKARNPGGESLWSTNWAFTISDATPTMTPTSTVTQTPIPTPTLESIPSDTETLTPTQSIPFDTETPTPTPTVINNPDTETPTPTQIYTFTYTPTQTSTPTPTATIPTPMVLQPSLSPAYSSTCGSPPSNWWKNPNGYTGYNGTAMFLTMNSQTSAQSTNYARWTPNVPLSGQYKVEIFVAYHPSVKWPCTNVSIYGDSSSAKYEVHHATGTNTVSVNQVPLDNAWSSLGTFRFNTGTAGYVKLSDVTGETFSTRFVSFNVIRLTWIGP